MLEKIKLIEEKYEELEAMMAKPEVYNDPAAVMKISREQKEIAPIVEAYREYIRHQKAADEAKAIADDENTEQDFREMALEEYKAAQASMEALEEKLKLLLLPKDPNDRKNVIVEIRGGAGGDRGCLPAPFPYVQHVC